MNITPEELEKLIHNTEMRLSLAIRAVQKETETVHETRRQLELAQKHIAELEAANANAGKNRKTVHG